MSLVVDHGYIFKTGLDHLPKLLAELRRIEAGLQSVALADQTRYLARLSAKNLDEAAYQKKLIPPPEVHNYCLASLNARFDNLLANARGGILVLDEIAHGIKDQYFGYLQNVVES
jgi:hypothetical protein